MVDDWHSYNETLVRRGQVMLDFDVVNDALINGPPKLNMQDRKILSPLFLITHVHFNAKCGI
jgi:hypothetical protein